MATTIEARRQTKRGRFYEIPQPPPHADKIALYGSVTTILSGAINKPALANWIAKTEREMVIEESTKLYLEMARTPPLTEAQWKQYLTGKLSATAAGQREMQKAGEIGTTVHHAIEEELNKRMGLPSKEVLLSDPAKLAFNHWLDWAASVELEPIASEQVIWSHTHKYAGTLDLLAKVNGKLSVIDWKTGKYVYNEAHLQNAAYRHAIREMGHGDPECGYIVRLPKTIDDPKFEAVPADTEAPSMEVFLNVQKLWLWMEEKQQKWESSQ